MYRWSSFFVVALLIAACGGQPDRSGEAFPDPNAPVAVLTSSGLQGVSPAQKLLIALVPQLQVQLGEVATKASSPDPMPGRARGEEGGEGEECDSSPDPMTGKAMQSQSARFR